MTDSDEQAGTSSETEGTEESPQDQGTDVATQIANARKRQAGAEAARQAAERKLADAEKELAAFRAQNQTASEKDLGELATLQERLKAAEQRAAEAEAKAEARILDAKYPNARKELPEVTDEVRLAKFEAMLREDDSEDEPPTPRRSNGTRAAGNGKPKERTIEDLEAEILATQVPWGRNK